MMRCRHVLAMLLAVLVLVISGCLDAKKFVDVSYDAKTDTFRMLRIFYHINSADQDDRTYLINMAMNREHILPTDVIGLLVESAQLRIDGKSFHSINLGAMGEKGEATVAAIDLSKIVNKPGKFFIAGENSLGYYHQVEIPGAQLDELIGAINDELRTELGKTLGIELQRRKAGGKTMTWDQARDEVLAQIANRNGAKNAAPAEEPESGGKAPFNVVSEDSIKLIQKAVADKKVGIVRKGSEFSLAMPATAEDRKGFMGLRDAVKNELAKAMEADEKNDPRVKTMKNIFDAASIVNDEKGGQIVTSADFLKLRKALEGTPGLFDLKQKADPAKAAAMTKTIAALKEAGVEVDEKIKLEEIPAMWEKGTLPVWKSEKAVEPGTGMFKAPGAKEGATDPASNPAPERFVPADGK